MQISRSPTPFFLFLWCPLCRHRAHMHSISENTGSAFRFGSSFSLKLMFISSSIIWDRAISEELQTETSGPYGRLFTLRLWGVCLCTGSWRCLSGMPVKIHRYLQTLCPVSLTYCIPSTGSQRLLNVTVMETIVSPQSPFFPYYCQYFGKNIKQTKSTASTEVMYCQRKTEKSLQRNVTDKWTTDCDRRRWLPRSGCGGRE